MKPLPNDYQRCGDPGLIDKCQYCRRTVPVVGTIASYGNPRIVDGHCPDFIDGREN